MIRAGTGFKMPYFSGRVMPKGKVRSVHLISCGRALWFVVVFLCFADPRDDVSAAEALEVITDLGASVEEGLQTCGVLF